MEFSNIDGDAYKFGATAHMAHILKSPFSQVIMYDSADDGPECEIITRILASHPWPYRPGAEKIAIAYSRVLDRAALLLYRKHFNDLADDDKAFVRSKTADYFVQRGRQ